MLQLIVVLQLVISCTAVYDYRQRWEPPLRPIVLVPGIGGSKLYDCTGSRCEDVWVTDDRSKYQSLIGYARDISYSSHNYGLDGICTFSLLGCRYDYMGSLIDDLHNLGYVDGETLFALPYDWRLSLYHTDHMRRLHLLVERHHPIVIAHSMGGLVVQEYFRLHPQNMIYKFYAVGTPFKGVGGNLLKGFIKGYNMENPYLSLDVSKAIIRNSYSSYWLLTSTMRDPPTINGKVPVTYLSENGYLIDDHIVSPTPVKIADTQVYYVVSEDQQTAYSYQQGADTFTYVDGDGTVPYESAVHHAEHGQEYANIIKVPRGDHMSIIRNFVQHAYFSLFSCYYDGTYRYRDDVITVTTEFGLRYVRRNGAIINSGVIYYRGCKNLDYNGNTYERVTGTECTRYHLYAYTVNGNSVEKKECLYGYVVSRTIDMCTSGYQWNPIKDTCIKLPPPVAPPMTDSDTPPVTSDDTHHVTPISSQTTIGPGVMVLWIVICVLTLMLIHGRVLQIQKTTISSSTH